MKKKVFGRRLKRDRNERKALFRSLVTSLVLKGKIETTEEKAKAVKGDVDRLITMAKKGRRDFSSYVFPHAVEKLTLEVVPAMGTRNSGYTRIVRLGKRLSDNASMVLMEWVDLEQVKKQKSQPKKEKTVKKVKKQKKVKKPTVSKKENKSAKK